MFSAIRWLQLSRIAAEPGTIQNDDNAPKRIYVDDGFFPAKLRWGAEPDGAGPAIAIGYDAFPTIQGGVNAVAATGTVNVASGDYFENVTVNKAATLRGANVGNPGAGTGVRGIIRFARSVIKVLSLRSHPTTSPSMALRLTAMMGELREIRSVAVKILILCMV